MKTTLLYCLVLLTMVGVGIGCKKEVEEVKPPVVVSPPTSGTANLPITNVGAWPGIGLADPTRADCRIVREEPKYPSTKLGLSPERMLIDGQEYLVSTATVYYYKYDSMGRLIEKRDSLENGFFYEKYTYGTNQIFLERKALYHGLGIVVKRDTISLNKQGLATTEFGGSWLRQYDSNGYLIRETYNRPLMSEQKIENGNLTERRGYFDDFTTINRYTYYLDISNLLNLQPFYGKQSRNLVASETIFIENGIYYDDGPQYRIDYYYLFDSMGRVKRQVGHGTKLSKKWPFGYGLQGISVANYQYECP